MDHSQSLDAAMPMQIDCDEGEANVNQIGRAQQKQEAAASSSSSSAKEKVDREESIRKRDLSPPNLDALYCPICMEPWGSQGDHQVSCLPCGHVYGLSCINRWIRQCGENPTKCPQCNAKCMLKDVRKIYASPIVVLNEDLQKRIESLEAEIDSLKSERADLLGIQDNLLNVQDNFLKELQQLRENPTCPEKIPLGEVGSKRLGAVTTKEAQGGQSGYYFASNYGHREILHCKFVLEHELSVEDARLFDMDLSYQILILARRISGLDGTHMLNKINLTCPQESEDILLPPSTKAVKDLHVSPCGRHTLLASLGKKLSILSMGSNSVVVTYDLPGPAWSCSWDINSPHYLYAGLQNGMLFMFDMRQTINPLQAMAGLTSRPIHTIHSLVNNPFNCHSSRNVLTASSRGPCVWNTASARERPLTVPGSENHGTCISLAYGPATDDIVASYYPKVQTSNLNASSQFGYSHPATLAGQGILGSQVLVKRVAGSFYHNLGSASTHLSDVQLKKSAVINMENCFPLFAYGDEVTHGLRLRELPSLTVTQNLKPHHHPILDVKYAHAQGTGLLGSVSEDKLQLFSAKAKVL